MKSSQLLKFGERIVHGTKLGAGQVMGNLYDTEVKPPMDRDDSY